MAGRHTTSLAVIARDEAESLPACLGSVRRLFDDVVVVDTGSRDATIDVARTFGATVVEFAWQDDFSAARNFAFSQCGGDFIFWMDADEILTPRARARLGHLFKWRLDRNTAYIMNHVSTFLAKKRKSWALTRRCDADQDVGSGGIPIDRD